MMNRFLSVLALLVVTGLLAGCTDALVNDGPDSEAVAAKKPAPQLTGAISYVFAGHLGILDDEGRLLAWDATITGDIEGSMKWWFVLGAGPPNFPEAAHVGFYKARWEIWDGETLLLAGKSSGTTAQPKGKDGIWRGNGVVTEAGPGYEEWIGRRILEGGNVNFDFPYSGTGEFSVN